jgi:Universal stress protein UspA and related nucleotide-binding proteins
MKKFLVPTDFSETSKNAANYAAQMAARIPGAKVILINVSDKFTAGSDGSPLTETKKDRRTILQQALARMGEEMRSLADVEIEFVIEEGSSLVETLERYVRHNGINMIVMGITGASRLEQLFIGSNTLDMVDAGVCPVMIVPPNAKFKPIQNVLFASDFENVDTTVPKEPIRQVFDLFKANLHVVNVDSEHYVEITDEYKKERDKLEKILAGYNPEFYFIRQYDFLDAVSQFTQDKNIDVIVTVPKERSFLSGLFKTSHTKKLAYHSHVPIVAVHE